jgi:uncharacterized protein with LGFP repeats
VAIPVTALLLVGGAFLAFSHFRAEALWQSVLGADNTPGQVRELRDEPGLEYRYERDGETIQVRVVGDIYQEYTQLDQHRGPLAFPLTGAREAHPSPYTTTRGRYQFFIRGTMYDLEGPGRAFYTDDDIHLRYWDEDSRTGWGQGQGGPQGPLGWPQGNPVDIRVGQVIYCFQRFERGAMYDTTPLGQEPIPTYTLGPIHEKYWDAQTWGAGKEGYQSVLGWPNADPRPAPVSPGGLTGEMQTFDHGAILSSDYGTFYLTGEIGVFYRDQGYSGSRLGFPLADPYTPPEGGTKQDFTGPLTATQMKAHGGAPGASLWLTPAGTLKMWVAKEK